MGRRKQESPHLTYAQWFNSGCPRLVISCSQLAEWLDPPISVQRIRELCRRGDLYRDDKNRVDTDNARNLAWLKARKGCAPPPKDSAGRNGGSHPLKEAVQAVQAEAPGAPLDLERILEAISQVDLSTLNGADIQKVARMETALKTRVEREAKRGLLIERRLVSTVFGRIYQIDSDQIRPLGAKLAPQIGAEFGIEDPGSILRIEQMVDRETNRILAHIKQLLDDFLRDVGAESA